MSADEVDESYPRFPQTYRIIRAKWQSFALRKFLRALDVKYIKLRQKPGYIGPIPRIRFESNARVEDRPAPMGLWRNCYDQVWLQGLKQDDRDALDVTDDDYDFDLTAQAPKDGRDGETKEV